MSSLSRDSSIFNIPPEPQKSPKMTPNVIESMLKDHQVFVFGEFLALDPIKKQMTLIS